MSLIDYKKEYQSELVKFIGNYLNSEYKNIEAIANSDVSDPVTYLKALRQRFLLYFIVVELYEKEYPFIAEKIYETYPHIKNLRETTQILIGKLKKVLPIGLSKIGANDIVFDGDIFFYRANNGDFYNILPEDIVGFPVNIGEKVEIQDYAKDFKFQIDFHEETTISDLSNKIFKKLLLESNSVGEYYEKLGTVFSVRKNSDYQEIFSFVPQSLKDNSSYIGFDESKKLCQQHADLLVGKVDNETIEYNKVFMERFSSEYSKRIQFLSLIGIFVSHLKSDDVGIWFLRDMIESYLFRKSFNIVKGMDSKDSLITISRNSTSFEKGDHYLYIVLNYIYYKAANESNGTYDSFVEKFSVLLKEIHQSDEKVKDIDDRILSHCENEDLESLIGGDNAKVMDLGFQGTFNVYLEALLKNFSLNKDNIKISSYLTGIWPWLTNILNNQYITTYFPAILINEFFDGIHEFAQYDFSDENNNPVFKDALQKHQLPAFLDTILIRDTALFFAKEVDNIPDLK